MTTSEARVIIATLASGRCPLTGEPLSGPYTDPDVKVALFTAVRALERVEQTEHRQESLPEQAGTGWTRREEEQLCQTFASGKTIDELAMAHKRTPGAIQRRLERLGMLAKPGLRNRSVTGG